MIIAQISDTHIALDETGSDQRIADFAATIDHINALNEPPDLIVHTGDVTHNGTIEEYELANEILARATSPTFMMAGNRDNRDNLKAVFGQYGYLNGQTDFIEYAVDQFPVKFVMLDSVSVESNKGDYCGNRFDALGDLLASESAKPIIVFIHHPPFMANNCPDPMQFVSKKVFEELRKQLGNFQQISAVLCGHVHRFDAGQVGTIPAYAMTCTPPQLRWGDYPPEMTNLPLYQLHRFDAKSGLTSSTQIVPA